MIDAGGKNLPGGEFYTSPVEDSAEGVLVSARLPERLVSRFAAYRADIP